MNSCGVARGRGRGRGRGGGRGGRGRGRGGAGRGARGGGAVRGRGRGGGRGRGRGRGGLHYNPVNTYEDIDVGGMEGLPEFTPDGVPGFQTPEGFAPT